MFYLNFFCFHLICFVYFRKFSWMQIFDEWWMLNALFCWSFRLFFLIELFFLEKTKKKDEIFEIKFETAHFENIFTAIPWLNVIFFIFIYLTLWSFQIEYIIRLINFFFIFIFKRGFFNLFIIFVVIFVVFFFHFHLLNDLQYMNL